MGRRNDSRSIAVADSILESVGARDWAITSSEASRAELVASGAVEARQPELRRPLISVGMPVFNVERTILDAVESIRHQTLADWELLIIDDGSTDRTREVLERVRDPRVRVIVHDENVGLGHRLNEAVAHSHGEYFARLDGDDVAYPDRLETQLAYLRAHPDVDVVGSWLVLLDPERRPFGSWRPPEHHEQITVRAYHGIRLAHPTYFGRREWFVKNPYTTEFLFTEDQILLMQTAPHSRFANVQRVLVGYRQPDTGLRAVLRRRVMSCVNVARYFAGSGQYGDLLRNLVSHSAVAAVESIAAVTRLRNRLLRHRVGALTDEQETSWYRIWSTISAAVRELDRIERPQAGRRMDPDVAPLHHDL